MEKSLMLNLGLGDAFRAVKSEEKNKKERSAQRRETQGEKYNNKEVHHEELSLNLSLRSVICEPRFSNVDDCKNSTIAKSTVPIEEVGQVPTLISSSFSNNKSSESQSKDVNEINNSFETETEDCVARKKLRLSQDQAASLEESFNKYNTLNPKQKLALARQLNLKPRQVEVWFQNRRARTKIKKTEKDYDFLKRCCHMLTLENRKLQKELDELRMHRKYTTAHSFDMHVKPSLCPSCDHSPSVISLPSFATVSSENRHKSSMVLFSKPGFGNIVTTWQ